jgi:hypothetical protein
VIARILDILNCDLIRRLTLASLFLLLETIDTSVHRVILNLNIWNSTRFKAVQTEFALVTHLHYVRSD